MASGDELIGVDAAKAARVVGVSVHQLAGWERIGLVVPQVHARPGAPRHVRVYGLAELVDARIVAELAGRGQSVRNIRRVVEAHRSNEVPHPLSKLRWAVDAGMIYVGYEDDSWVGGHRPHQRVMVEVIDLEEIRASARSAARARPESAVGRLEQRASTMGRKPVFAGTRTPVDAVAPYLRRKVPNDEILEAFPHLDPADLDAARERIGA